LTRWATLIDMVESRWGSLQLAAERLAAHAAAARTAAAGARGSDQAAAVTTELNLDGRVDAVHVAADWRDRLRARQTADAPGLADAVVAAIRAATTARLEAWAHAVEDPPSTLAAAPVPGTGDDFLRRLQQAAASAPGDETGQAALHEILNLLKQIEQGIDQVSTAADGALRRSLQGRSRDGQAAVTMTGGGDIERIRYQRHWLRHAHTDDIARQTMAALHDAYQQLDRGGIGQLIADSPLGAAQRTVQDPFGLAQRMRLTS
jgi:DNA-binding protein YbaB